MKIFKTVFNKVNENKNIEDGFIVELSNWVFGILEKLSIFYVIRSKHRQAFASTPVAMS